MEERNFGVVIDNLLPKEQLFSSTKSAHVIVDKELNVLYFNNKKLSDVKEEQQRPGDLLRCVNALHGPNGCGSATDCTTCRLRSSVRYVLETNKHLSQEVTLLLEHNNKMVIQETALPFSFDNENYVAIFIVDISDKKQEQILEHVFFHDMVNLAGAMESFVEILEEEPDPLLLSEVKKLSSQILEEILAQKELVFAEKGMLNCSFKKTTIIEFMNHAAISLAPMVNAKEMELITDIKDSDTEFETDSRLLHRIVVNMVKNAAEASPEGSIIKIASKADNDSVTISVNNPTVIPMEHQGTIFRYGSSTKGEGRGIGTYSMKLFGENYLKGSVGFTSNEEQKTTFFITIPKSHK